MKLLLIRHGLTEWNSEKRIQGQTDIPLSSAGIEQVSRRRLSADLHKLTWYTSPLQRALQTANLMGIVNPIVEPALTEMNWGDWEGEVLKPLRKRLGDVMRDNEARGLDFCPPNGESLRQVQDRIRSWLAEISIRGEDCGAVVHQGIIRCVYSMANCWDMRGETPVCFDWEQGHLFECSDSGTLVDGYTGVDLV